MYPSGLIRSPFFSKKVNSHRSQKPKNRKFGLSKVGLIRSPKNRCRYGGLLVSRTFFGAPYQLFKRFPPQNGRFGPNFLKLFEKPHGLLISFSRSAERTTFRSGPQKEALSKVCRKFDTNCTPHSAERTFHRLFALICLVCCFSCCFLFVFFHSLSLFSFFCCFAVRRKRRKKKENKMNEKMTNNQKTESKSGR